VTIAFNSRLAKIDPFEMEKPQDFDSIKHATLGIDGYAKMNQNPIVSIMVSFWVV
jgi:hypothetical protein